ncbi:hypothetical protein ADEAN_000560300 [Angomonas deanei]|uniref:Uncharacterized protein n=1 Tax=Angomonas deanei TaxID=59799 RepID=A0A7G2CGF3_9TRYP|nr:hypothetical protein ADEAN_000560300 [Angomonas deanei]
MSGKITEKAEIKVTFCPQIPDEVHEFFSVQVGHFDPQRIDVVGRGQVNSLGVRGADDVAAVSRWTDPTFNEALSALKKQQQEKGLCGATLRD